MIDRAERSGLCFLAMLRCRRVLALRQPVDTVVEEHDVQIKIAAQCMERMVTADRKTVAVAGCNPYIEFRICCLNAGSNGECASVNRMQAIRIHVIRETRRAADTCNEDRLVTGDVEIGKRTLYLCEDRV